MSDSAETKVIQQHRMNAFWPVTEGVLLQMVNAHPHPEGHDFPITYILFLPVDGKPIYL